MTLLQPHRLGLTPAPHYAPPEDRRERPLLGKYIFDPADPATPIECPDVIKWGQWFETADRVVAHDRDEGTDGEVLVSTVFLGLDHNYSGRGAPVLWETMVLGGLLDGEQRRYDSFEKAMIGHQEMCQRVNASLHHPGAENVRTEPHGE